MNRHRQGGRVPAVRDGVRTLTLDPNPALDDFEADWHFDDRNGTPSDSHAVGTAVPASQWPAWTDHRFDRVCLALRVAEGRPHVSR